MSFLQLDKLEKRYDDGTLAVKGIDLEINEGEFIVLLGPSGCGKTTTLRMIAGLELPTAGKIRLQDEDISNLRPAKRDVGFVFQFYALYPHMNIEKNVAFPLECQKLSPQEVNEKVEKIMSEVGITHLRHAKPAQLSGGDQQRVSLARAMVRHPKLYLMDEPLGTLDADLRLEMRELIRRQQLERGVTTLYVTHDQEEAMSLADRIVVMRDGLIHQFDNPNSVYHEPASHFVAHFVGSPGMNLLQGTIKRVEGRCTFVPKEQTHALALQREIPEGDVTLGIRPEFVSIVDDGSIEGTCQLNEYCGSFHALHVDSPFGRIVARHTREELKLSGQVKLNFDEKHLCFFDSKNGGRIS